MSGGQMHTIGELLDSNSLPLLVQQRSGVRLLLHRSIRLPYVVCQSLGSLASDHHFFLIPLSNKGFYGPVSRHDEPTSPYANLSHILQEPTLSDSIDILIDNVTPVRCLDKDTNKFTSKVLLPGEVIHIVRGQRCALLNERKHSTLCCFGSNTTELAEDTICVKDTHRHIHMDKYMTGRFYVVSTTQFSKMESGHAYNLQDITQHQGLPKVVCCVSAKQTSRDELPLPNVFRIIKVISDRITLAYSLLASNHPMPENILEVSSYNQELFTVAESSRIIMDDIRDHQSARAIRKAIPGITISLDDYNEITRKGSSFPPKLPGRPPTLRLKSSNTDTNRLISQVHRVSLMGDTNVDSRDGHTTPNRRSLVTPNHTSSYTVNLPTKDRKSILKRFSSVSASKNKDKPSMKSILDKLHGKSDDNNNSDNDARKRTKKSLRGLEIVHVLPDAHSTQEIDLSKSLFSSPKHNANNSTNESTISSTTSSQEQSSHRMEAFIHSHYNFLDKHHDNSSHYSAPHSDGSHRDSAVSGRSIVRFTDINSDQPSSQIRSPSSNRPTESDGHSRRSLRESLAKSSAVVDDTQNQFVVWNNTTSNHGSTQIINVPKPDYDRPSSTYLSTGIESHGKRLSKDISAVPLSDRPPSERPPKEIPPTEKPHNERAQTESSPPINDHLVELRKRFTLNENGGLKPSEDRKNDPQKKSPSLVADHPISIIDELKTKFDGSAAPPVLKAKKGLATVTKQNPYTHDDTYLLPLRSSGCIKLTG